VGHSPHLEEPDRFAELLAGLLARDSERVPPAS